ncbi:RnfABCDGE type electron transport complex subunit A [candidate division KSB1 bacterium]|nr:RnfABCDGE type electron transport complex subunit A [candidate division KSB1 bacterium]
MEVTSPNLFVIIITAVFINNFVFARFLGTCPYLGVSKNMDSAIGMGMAVIFVLVMASMVTWIVNEFLLKPTTSNIFYIIFSAKEPPDLTYLKTIVFILVIASLVQFVEMVIQKVSPTLYRSLGIFLPLITTNCVILAVAILNVDAKYSFIESIIHGLAAGLGFTLALILMAGIRERLELAPIPKPLRGIPIAFVVAGLMSIAFLGFAGLKIK